MELKFWGNVHLPKHVTCHVSHVTCHMSHVTCHMSHVLCRMSQFFFSRTKWWSLAGEGYQRGLPRLVQNKNHPITIVQDSFQNPSTEPSHELNPDSSPRYTLSPGFGAEGQNVGGQGRVGRTGRVGRRRGRPGSRRASRPGSLCRYTASTLLLQSLHCDCPRKGAGT